MVTNTHRAPRPRRRIVTAVAVATAMVTLAACSGGGGEPNATDRDGQRTRILVWDQIVDDEVMQTTDELAEQFMDANPDIEVVIERYQAQEMDSLAKNAFRSQATPDLIYTEVGTGRDLYRAGLAAPLNEFAEEYGWYDRVTEAGLAWTTADDGTLWGLGLETEASGVLWNTTRLDELGLSIPTTTEELLDYCRAASAAGYVPIMAGAGGSGWIYYFLVGFPIVNALGTEAERAFVQHQGDVKWTDPVIADAVSTVLVDGKEAGCFIPEMNGLDSNVAFDQVLGGDIVGYSPAFTGANLTRVANEAPDFEWAFTPWPAVPDGVGSFHQLGMGSTYVANERSEHKEAVAEFLDFMISEPSVVQLIERAGFLPPVPVDVDGLDIGQLSRDAIVALNDPSTQTGISIDILSSGSFNDLIGRGGSAVYEGSLSVPDYLAQLQEAWEDEPR